MTEFIWLFGHCQESRASRDDEAISILAIATQALDGGANLFSPPFKRLGRNDEEGLRRSLLMGGGWMGPFTTV